jgi:hypothetical protein
MDSGVVMTNKIKVPEYSLKIEERVHYYTAGGEKYYKYLVIFEDGICVQICQDKYLRNNREEISEIYIKELFEKSWTVVLQDGSFRENLGEKAKKEYYERWLSGEFSEGYYRAISNKKK